MNIFMGEYSITTDKSKINIDIVHNFLCNEAYWCKGIPLEILQRSIDNSLNFILLHGENQIGYARVVSDYATVAYLGDVFVVPKFRRQGLSKWLIREIMNHPDLQGLRRWILLTRDAHELYQQFGWNGIAFPERWMEIHNKDIYNPTTCSD
jgi:GNAT superfamily N-acetyltransferase